MIDFQNLFESTPDSYLIVGVAPHFTILAANDAYLRLTLTAREDIVGRAFFAVSAGHPATPHASRARAIRHSFETAIATRTRQVLPPTQYDLRPSTNGDFEERFWRICNVPLLDPTGHVEAILHRVEDVTAIVQLEHARREQQHAREASRRQADLAEKIIATHTGELTRTQRKLVEGRRLLQDGPTRFEVAINSGDVATFVWEPQNDRVHPDETLTRWLLLPPDRSQVRPLAEYLASVHPGDLAAVNAAIQHSLAGAAPPDLTFQFRRNGEWRDVLLRSRAERGTTGRPLRFVGVLIDITRQRQVEAELHESEARYRLVVESLQDYAIFMLDDAGLVTHWNAGAERLLGYTTGEILGQSARILFTPEDRHRGVPEKELAIAAAQGSASDDRWHLKKNGTRFFVTGLMVSLNDDRGRRIGFAKIMRDITDRQAAAVERERLLESERAARAEAERTSRLKDEFLATLSHELRTPLNAILGWTQVLKAGGLSPTEVAEGLDVIDRNTHVQAELIEDLLDMSRIVSGNVRLKVQPLDLARAVDAAIESVQVAADAKHIALRRFYHHESAWVMGDRTRLQQIAWNLLSNAIKFTPEQGQVDITTELVASHVILRVRDNGAGISRDFLPHVFERFRQGDASTTRRHGGLGLGLSIVKQLVELHGGDVSADSAGPGRGTTVTVSIPIVAAEKTNHGAPPAPKRRAVARAAPRVDLAGVKVLVVEDDADSAQLVRRVLEGHQAEVRTAASMHEGLDALREFHPHVLLSDIGMPQHDGYEFIRRVRELPGGTALPCAALTALARAEDVERALAAGFKTHVSKPVEPAELLAVVAGLAGRTPPDD